MSSERDFPFLRLNRPEYPRNPEAPLSALAWSLTPFSHTRQPGRVFQVVVKSRRDVRATRPEVPQEWVASLQASGLDLPPGLEAFVASSLLDGIGGVQADKATALSAVPLVPNAAFLQNPVGMHAKDGPPNFAAIIEQIFAAGSSEPVESDAAASAFFRALTHQERQPVFAMLDKALRPLVSDGEFQGYPFDVMPRGGELRWIAPTWLAQSPNPFCWFREAWTTFCQPEWREVLPRRRWSDWSSCIVRTGVGLAFLWEAQFFRLLGRAIVTARSGPDDSLAAFMRGSLPVLDWRSSDSRMGARDMNQRIIRILIDGQAVRAKIQELLGESATWSKNLKAWSGERGLEKFTDWARAQKWSTELADCFGRSRDSSANNLIETVVYLLQSRQSLGLQADFYGLLSRKKKRFVVVEPGLEWIVVIASIAAGRPGQFTNLRAIRHQLRLLGISTPREVLVSELERAGLARSSHDADDAIVVQPGF